jgi:hypothetical protein
MGWMVVEEEKEGNEAVKQIQASLDPDPSCRLPQPPLDE